MRDENRCWWPFDLLWGVFSVVGQAGGPLGRWGGRRLQPKEGLSGDRRDGVFPGLGGLGAGRC